MDVLPGMREATREDEHIPDDLRAFVLDRDGRCCRVCGRYVEYPALHHIEYRSEGGLDVPSNLITIGWLFDHDCHCPWYTPTSASGSRC
jgi:5-methylcytosine-specific restriction endonuclease McrA